MACSRVGACVPGRSEGVLTRADTTGASSHTPSSATRQGLTECDASVQASSAAAASAGPMSVRAVNPRQPAVAWCCRLAAVVHSIKCLRLTVRRYSVRPMASTLLTACCSNWLVCHSPPRPVRHRSVAAAR